MLSLAAFHLLTMFDQFALACGALIILLVHFQRVPPSDSINARFLCLHITERPSCRDVVIKIMLEASFVIHSKCQAICMCRSGCWRTSWSFQWKTVGSDKNQPTTILGCLRIPDPCIKQIVTVDASLTLTNF